MRVTFALAGQPRGKGRPRVSVRRTENPAQPAFARVYTPAKTRHYEAALAFQAQAAMVGKRLLEGQLRVLMTAVFSVPASWSKRKRGSALSGALRPTKKPDADNILKCCDALNGVVFKDDSQIVDARVTKWYGPAPELEVTVEEIAVLTPA
jgi:Holliday junction resolvase RusA-like endonuclease